MAEMGTHVVIVGFLNNGPILSEGLVNESYLSLDLEQLLQEMEKHQIANGSTGSPTNPAPGEP